MSVAAPLVWRNPVAACSVGPGFEMRAIDRSAGYALPGGGRLQRAVVAL